VPGTVCRVVQSDGHGRGMLMLIPAGTWTATVSAEGFESKPLRIELHPK
jgi:hypothetical protein